MKRNFILGLLVVAGFLFLSSCKDDETPIAGISFELEEQEVTESDGTELSFHPEIEEYEGEGRVIQVKLIFNRKLAGNAVIKFDVDGTAREKAISSELNDFEILEESEGVTIDGDEITIQKGATEATFDILVFEDYAFEYDEDVLNDDDVSYETILLTLESVVSGPVKLGAQLEHTVKILEDDAVAFLQWAAVGMTPVDANVDMDILFWLNGSIAWSGARVGTTFEALNIPAGLGEGDFGVSYTYYSGNSDDLNFVGAFFTTAGTLEGERYPYTLNAAEADPLTFEGHYTLANINEWDAEGGAPLVSQTMTKDGIDYSNISGLTDFETGSRVGKKFKLDKAALTQISLASKGYTSRGQLKK